MKKKCKRNVGRPHFPFPPVFIVTGACCVGKTAIIPDLRKLLPEFDIIDGDSFFALGDKYGWSIHRNTLLQIASEICKNNRSPIICSAVFIDDFDTCSARSSLRYIYFLNLHCSDDIRKTRLVYRLKRKGWEQNKINDFISENNKMAIELHNTISDTLEVSAKSIAEAAKDVASWIKINLPMHLTGVLRRYSFLAHRRATAVKCIGR